jgi:hypothetical protein
MPNAALIKDDETPLILPADVFTAILSTKRAANAAHPDAGAVVFALWRGTSVIHLRQTAAEVFAELEGKFTIADGRPSRKWLRLPIEDDFSYIDAEAIDGVEGVKVDGELMLRVHFSRHDGAPFYADGDYSDEALAEIGALVRTPAPAAPALPFKPA